MNSGVAQKEAQAAHTRQVEGSSPSPATLGFRPVLDYVVVDRAARHVVTGGGIVIPEQARRRRNVGVIVAMSAEARRRTEAKIGDRVFFHERLANDMEWRGRDLALVHAEDVALKVGDVFDEDEIEVG